MEGGPPTKKARVDVKTGEATVQLEVHTRSDVSEPLKRELEVIIPRGDEVEVSTLGNKINVETVKGNAHIQVELSMRGNGRWALALIYLEE